MHILVVNDDGPPSPHSSPYIHSFVRALQASGHTVSVCLPHAQRSWIGKAHMIGQTIRATYYRPPPPSSPPAGLRDPSSSTSASAASADADGSTHTRPHPSAAVEEWVLVDGTPASCVQIGLHHFFQDRGPVDLVVSGPNYGRNTTAVFALSSGTLGGALEAAVCRRRAVALSFAFFSRNHDPEIVVGACRQAVRVVEALVRGWPEGGEVDLYSVNVPLVEGVEGAKTVWTGMLQNYWRAGSCFEVVEGSVDGDGEVEEERIREGDGGEAHGKGEKGGRGGGEEGKGGHRHQHFKWAPRFSDVYSSVDEAGPGNDGWTVKEGQTSVTPLKANFWHAVTHLHQQELQLEPYGHHVTPREEVVTASEKTRATIPESGAGRSPSDTLYALVAYEDAYVQPMILEAIKSLVSKDRLKLLNPPSHPADDGISLAALVPNRNDKVLQITSYETIDFDYAASYVQTSLVNSYMIRKALIRKHFLSATVDQWIAKRPQSVLHDHVKRSEAFEVDYAEFLDDALVEAFDLRASLDRNEGDGGLEAQGGGDAKGGSGGGLRPPEEREWWILKPGMSDRGQGIKLFSTMADLQGIFDAWEAEQPDSDEEDDDEENVNAPDDEAGTETPRLDGSSGADTRDYITTSHLRHFVAQPYINPPLLLPGDQRKFHIRTYVLCVGSMKVYVYRPMLALFAAKPYAPPWETADLDAHLTNTCLQGGDDSAKEGSVRRFWDLDFPADVSGATIFAQICQVTGEVFEAAARGMLVHFQPLPNAFEVYGLDFVVDAGGTAWLLEVNAFPDFKQTGDELRGVVAEFWAEVLRLAVGPFVDIDISERAGEGEAMVLVREVDLGRR